jgi:RNA polymerase sigma factor (sigma-70 family)
VTLRRVRSQGQLRVERGDGRQETEGREPGRSENRPSVTTRTDGRDFLERRGPHGGRGPLTEDQRALVVSYLPMARQLAQRLCTTWQTHPEELQSTADMALVEAAHTFDPSRKVGFSTYARHRIRGALRDCQRLIYSAGSRETGARRPVFQKLRKFDEQNGVVLGIEPEPPVGSSIESTEVVEFWLRRLPKAHAAACRLIYIHGKSQDQVAAAVGCSKSYLSRVHREAINWLIRNYHEAIAAHEGCTSNARE